MQHAPVHWPLALAMAALVEGDGGQSVGDGRAGEVVVALLARAGAVENDHPGARRLRIAGRYPQRVGQAVGAGGLHGQQRGDGARPSTISFAAVNAIAAALSHIYPRGTRVDERGRLELGGCDAVQLAREFGTPCYVVVEDDLRSRGRELVDALAARHDDFDVLFASKAFPCTAVYRVLAEEGLACDVASGGELALALAAGFDPGRTYLHGNAKSDLELRQALAAGVGLHAHIGSQLFSLEPFRAAVRALARLGDFPVYNLGGGLGAAYTNDQRPPSVERYVEAIVDAVHAELGTGKRLLLEPGRALVANSTVTLYTVQTVKRNVSTWVAVDGGMSDNLRPMLYDSRYEAVIADRPLVPGRAHCHLAGKHCE